jgi:hypothetical protein
VLQNPPVVPSGLNEFDLLNLDPTTKAPPESRLRDVRAANSIYDTLRKADEKSSSNRARYDGMFDGAPPYDQRVLSSTGQGARANLNLGEAQRYLDISMSAFVDLYTSLDRLMQVKTTVGEPTARQEADDIIAEELTHMLRDWPEFHSHYLRLCTEFTKHGVSAAYFDDPRSWRFRVCGLGDFLIPRQTVASEEAIEVACCRRQYLLHELYAFIKNPEAAAKLGWDVEEVKRVIMRNARTTGYNGSNTYADWEATQREMKGNDLYTGLQNTTASVIHMWIREFDGSVSFVMFGEETPKSFMFRGASMFKKPEQAYVLFSYGVGSNGTYHSVRGLGHRIFNHVQLSNRFRCQMFDSAMLGGAVMIQPESQRALEDLSFTMYGPYSVLSPNVRIVEKASPNLTNAMLPALNDLQSQLAMNVDLVSTYGNQSSPYRNNLQTEHDLAVASRLTGSTINLFYASWGRLLREVVRRAVLGAGRDPQVQDFVARCAARGVTLAQIKSLDTSKTVAVRAIGAGSAANRLLALRELNQIAGGFDDTGRRNLLRDITAERVGRDLVDRYAPPAPEPRLTVDAKIAMLENQSMQLGQPVAVLESELHGMHLRGHAPLLQQLLSGIQEGTVDPVQALPIVTIIYEHFMAHLQLFAADPMAKAEVAGYKQLTQIAEEVITNTGRKVQAMQRKQQEAEADGAAEDPAQAGPSAMELKLQEHQLKMQIEEQKAQLDMQIKQSKAEQDRTLKDAERALKFAGNVTQ